MLRLSEAVVLVIITLVQLVRQSNGWCAYNSASHDIWLERRWLTADSFKGNIKAGTSLETKKCCPHDTAGCGAEGGAPGGSVCFLVKKCFNALDAETHYFESCNDCVVSFIPAVNKEVRVSGLPVRVSGTIVKVASTDGSTVISEHICTDCTATVDKTACWIDIKPNSSGNECAEPA